MAYQDLWPVSIPASSAWADALELLLQMLGSRSDSKILVGALQDKATHQHLRHRPNTWSHQNNGRLSQTLESAVMCCETCTCNFLFYPNERACGKLFGLYAKFADLNQPSDRHAARRMGVSWRRSWKCNGCDVPASRVERSLEAQTRSLACRAACHALWLDIEKPLCGAASRGVGRDKVAALTAPELPILSSEYRSRRAKGSGCWW